MKYFYNIWITRLSHLIYHSSIYIQKTSKMIQFCHKNIDKMSIERIAAELSANIIPRHTTAEGEKLQD